MWYMQDLFSSIYLAGIETNPFILLFGLYGVPNRAWGTATLVLRWPPNTQAQAYTHTHTHTQAHTSTVHLEPPPSLWILIQLLCWWLHNLVQRQVFITVKSINDTARLSNEHDANCCGMRTSVWVFAGQLYLIILMKCREEYWICRLLPMG